MYKCVMRDSEANRPISGSPSRTKMHTRISPGSHTKGSARRSPCRHHKDCRDPAATAAGSVSSGWLVPVVVGSIFAQPTPKGKRRGSIAKTEK